MTAKRVATAILICALARGVAYGASPPTDAADRQAAALFAARIESLRDAARIPGLAVVVLRGTKVVLARGFGYADVERGVPVTAETPFNIASVSKPISAVVALALVEQGLLDLDRPMTDYAGFVEYCADVREAGGIFFRDFECDRCPLTLRQVLSMEANGVPGTRFFYNPPAYSWASRPMAEVSGRRFSDLVVELVFEPAGMTRSARIHRKLPLAPALARELAKPYHAEASGKFAPSDPPPPQGDGAAGGVIATAMDLARFDIALSEGRLVAPGSRAAMWTAGRSPSGSVLPYGLGWFVQERGGEKLVWHTGLWEGAYSALYLKALDRDVTLVLLANSEGLRWDGALDEAAIDRSPFAAAFLEAFSK